MRDRRTGGVFLIVALMLAAGAALLSVRFVKSFNETTKVYVAVNTLPPYKQVTKDDVRLTEIPAISAPADAIRKTEDFLGLYTKETIYAGEPLRKARLSQVQGKEAVLTAKLSAVGRADVRAFALPFDAESGVGGQINPGDRVDIIASVRMESGSGTIGVGKIIGRNVQVIDVIRQGGQNNKSVLIVMLTPKEIEDIAFALTSGTIRFALNPYNSDVEAANTPGVTGQDWLIRHGFGTSSPSAR